jgi:prepilin-type N-terminal cleavage/methylation domain-containing protein
VNGYSSIKGQGHDRREDSGFTLVEILIAIVLVGILSAVVVVGIASLTDTGAKSACAASADAARAGTVVYFATQGEYPTTMVQLTEDVVAPGNPAPAALEKPELATVDPTTLVPDGDAWTLTMVPPAVLDGKPTFECS